MIQIVDSYKKTKTDVPRCHCYLKLAVGGIEPII
jgi:hypothetical protein